MVFRPVVTGWGIALSVSHRECKATDYQPALNTLLNDDGGTHHGKSREIPSLSTR